MRRRCRPRRSCRPTGPSRGNPRRPPPGRSRIKLRQLAASIEARGQGQWAETYFKTLGWHGKASFQFDPPRDRLAPVYTCSASFELEARPEFLDGKAFEPPAGGSNAGSSGRVSPRLLDAGENGADTLLLRSSGRGIVTNLAAGPRHRIAAAGQDCRKSLSALPVGLEPRRPGRDGAARDNSKAAGGGMPR